MKRSWWKMKRPNRRKKTEERKKTETWNGRREKMDDVKTREYECTAKRRGTRRKEKLTKEEERKEGRMEVTCVDEEEEEGTHKTDGA